MTATRLTWAALAVWCTAALGLGAAGTFVGPPGRPPLAIVAAVTVPLALYGVAYLGSHTFRAFVLSADLRLVAALQGWRWAGLGFLSLWAHGVLPGLFAWPAGLGVAVSLGGLSAMFLRGSVTTAPMAELPLVAIPAFLVPLFLMLHITALLQARQAPTGHGEARAVPA